MTTIHVTLSRIRERRRLSQRQLAAIAGMRPDTISALERGKSTGIQFETLARLCDVLDCEPGDLLDVERDRDAHEVPVLGGPDEDAILEERLRSRGKVVDGPSFLAELLKLSEDDEAAVAERHS